MPHQRGIRDEFNSDWSLSITSSLSGTFSLLVTIYTQQHSLRFVSLLAVAIAHNVLSFPLYLPLPHLLIRFCSCLYVFSSLSISYLVSFFHVARREVLFSFYPAPSYLSRVSNVTRTASEYEFNLAVRR